MFKIGDTVEVICEGASFEKGTILNINRIGKWNGEALYTDINKSIYIGVIASEIILVKEKLEVKTIKKTFKEVIADKKEGEVWEGKLFLINTVNGITRIETKNYEFNQGDYALIFDDTKEFTLQRKKVSFTEAFAAYEEGKEIESCVSGARFRKERLIYETKVKDTVYNQELNKFVEITKGYGIEIEEISNDWYIN